MNIKKSSTRFMSRLIESIRLFNGAFSRLAWHQARIDNSCQSIFGKKLSWRLVDILAGQAFPKEGLHKCRVVYDDQAVSVEFSAYQPRPIHSLKLVTMDGIEYNHKWADRTQLESAFALRGKYDDILIVKNGMITDTFYGNIAFEKEGQWFTPETCLLPGTMRQWLLDCGIVRSCSIPVHQIGSFTSCRIINALLEFNEPMLDVYKIY